LVTLSVRGQEGRRRGNSEREWKGKEEGGKKKGIKGEKGNSIFMPPVMWEKRESRKHGTMAGKVGLADCYALLP
jgi:hypothetical protein